MSPMVNRKRFVRRVALPLMTLACAAGVGMAISHGTCRADSAEEAKVAPTTPAAPQVVKKTKEELLSPANVQKISQAYGHFIAKSLDNPLLKLNFDSVMQGMNDQKNGKPSPMTEQEYEEAITQLQEISFQETSEKNRRDAEQFLKENSTKPNVQTLEDGKLQILVQSPGTGDVVVTEEVMPVIHYTGSYINGTVFGSSKDAKEPLSISLNQTIPGFKKGILGMKVGERRQIFIHPDLGYGTSGQLMPNALLIFDVELVKVNPLPKNSDADEGEEMDMESSVADDDDNNDLFGPDDDLVGPDALTNEDTSDDSDGDEDQDIDFDTEDSGPSQ